MMNKNLPIMITLLRGGVHIQVAEVVHLMSLFEHIK